MYIVNVYASCQQGLGMLLRQGALTDHWFFIGTLAGGIATRYVFGLGLLVPGIPHV